MKVKEITSYLEEIAPLQYAEDFDNVGLIIGNPDSIVKNILVTLDTTSNVIDEAIEDAKFTQTYFKLHSQLRVSAGQDYVEFIQRLFTTCG